MEIIFTTNKLQRCYEDSKRAAREWGPEVGPRYIRRITTLYAMQRFSEIFQQHSWYAHPLKGQRAEQISIRLTGQWRLIVEKGMTDATVIVREVSNHYD